MGYPSMSFFPQDGRVKAGDQILAVDGNSLLGLDQDA